MPKPSPKHPFFAHKCRTSARHAFKVIDSTEVATNIREAEFLIREINPIIQMIYTISPVPLIATFQNMSVLQSNALSKAVLRSAIYDFFGTEKSC
ncbi:MAG: hypothetical protein EBW73_09055, partial [Betaproteobacteria bacterium]|nr:hypothetical protein [Betaproteobacteria bacterium]